MAPKTHPVSGAVAGAAAPALGDSATDVEGELAEAWAEVAAAQRDRLVAETTALLEAAQALTQAILRRQGREVGLPAERAQLLEELATADGAFAEARRLAHECQAELERLQREALAAGPASLDDFVWLVLGSQVPWRPSTCRFGPTCSRRPGRGVKLHRRWTGGVRRAGGGGTDMPECIRR